MDDSPVGASPKPRADAAVSPAQSQDAAASGHYADLQSAARFPIKLPISVKSNSGERHSETENISANGVLFQMDAAMPVGSALDFTISLPADIVGSEADVQVDCRGRVVRSFADGERVGVGVVIDEYHFKRAEQEN
ncbi:MAG TPA: PilZ domain-containing protein [Terriglobales bacterium]|jgi:hypothetical protein